MIDCPVNIADFRCRAIKVRTSHSPVHSTAAQAGLALVAPHCDTAASKHPRVYDIGVAREAQRTRHRVLFRPISILPRAKVLRFHESPAGAAVHAMSCWTPAVDGPSDFPPAA